MNIRKTTKSDYDQVWNIFTAVIKTGDTYMFLPNTTRSEMEILWFADYITTFVVEEKGQILGTYIIKDNQIGLGNHIANCSYMVSPKAQGRGIGKKLCEHSIQFSKDSGYMGIQFNAVVSSNKGAIALWKKYGFEIIGITPKGFRHASLGLMDTYIMFKSLD
ncbi:MAG: GNAT family N-acetyltransferase [Pricia sp.]